MSNVLLEPLAPSPDTGVPDAAALSPSDRPRIATSLRSAETAIVQRWWRSQFASDLIQRYAIAGTEEVPEATLRSGFVLPLLRLLVQYLESGADAFRDVYLDERLRYAPHQASPAVRTAFFREVIHRDEEALLDALASESDREALAQALDELHRPLVTDPPTRSVRLLAVGDCLMNEIRVFLQGACRRRGTHLDFRSLYFGAQQGKGIDAEQVLRFLEANPMDLVALSFLTYEGIQPYRALLFDADRISRDEIEQRASGIVGLMDDFIRQLRARTDIPFLLHNSSGLPLSRWRRRVPVLAALSENRRFAVETINRMIAELVEHSPNTILLDEASVAEDHGHRNASAEVIPARIARGALFHTSRFGELLAEPYADVVRSYETLRKAKVLLVDFDNTLWEGVMADGPVVHNHPVQAALQRARNAGILLVSLSKNDPGLVRWEEMTLKPEDFVLHKISWNLKPQSILEAAQELDLGVDSFVLIDDNPVERELVRMQLPQVPAFDPADPFTMRSLRRLLDFPNTRETEEARQRTELYREQAQRRRALSQEEMDYPAMMKALGLEARFGAATRRDLDRIEELVQRTNQFNTTTIRHSRQALQAFLDSDRHGVYVCSLADKFGNLGQVAVTIVERANDERVIDTFVMSCRAMGFGLETLALRMTLDAEEVGAARFIGRFRPTDRNGPASALYSSCGFVQRDAEEWVLEATEARPEIPSWFSAHRE